MPNVDGWSGGREESIDEMMSILSRTSVEHGDGPTEAFLRSSTLTKVELDAQTGETIERVGREHGGALRWFDSRRGTTGFVAATGNRSRSLAVCRAIAASTPGKPSRGCPWNEEATSLEDHDAHCGRPDSQELRQWLLAKAPDGLDQAWVEAGWSTETWLIGPETVQSRRRSRAWACWMPRAGHLGARPLFMAARSWTALQGMDPARAWQDHVFHDTREKSWPTDAQLVFSPQTSAFLALLLTRVAHHPQAAGGPVGPGWILATGCRGTLFGSDADDAGFRTTERPLADGREVIDSWGGPGQLRRGSFRDAPEPTPVPLVLRPPALEQPHRAVLVTRIEVHPTGSSWLLRLHGRRYPEGAGFAPHWMRVRPRRVLEACLGGVGSVRESHAGVTTPALVFDTPLMQAD